MWREMSQRGDRGRHQSGHQKKKCLLKILKDDEDNRIENIQVEELKSEEDTEKEMQGRKREGEVDFPTI